MMAIAPAGGATASAVTGAAAGDGGGGDLDAGGALASQRYC